MKIEVISSPPLALKKLIRQADTHKGLYGSVAVIGGAPKMVGAALLAGRAALNLGAGKVHLGLLKSKLIVDFMQPELMISNPKLLLKSKLISHILIGPGLGQSTDAKRLISKCLLSETPLIIDADGLNLIASSDELQSSLQQRLAETIITPHPTEAARLLNLNTTDIQLDRHNAIKQLYQKFRCGIILKGHETLILNDSIIYQNQTGNSALSSAGQGDVLSGIILALWAQGLHLIDASCCGVFLHGQAADLWRDGNSNRIGLTANQTINLTQICLNNYLAIQKNKIVTR